MATVYEWTVEHVDQFGDIIMSDHHNTKEDALKQRAEWAESLNDGEHVDVALVRDVYRGEDLIDRDYAYLCPYSDDFVETCFAYTDIKIPARFID